MSRFVLANLAVGVIAAAVGFGNFAGVPNQAVFAARVLFGLCLLLLVALLISNIGTATPVRKRPLRDRDRSRDPR
jgi:uncharacterized membrane protein YtjA (UPF0391 family)